MKSKLILSLFLFILSFQTYALTPYSHRPRELIIKYNGSMGEVEIESIRKLYNLSLLDKSQSLKLYLYLVPSNVNIEILRREVEAEINVEYAEYNYFYHADEYNRFEAPDDPMPDDPMFQDLWALSNHGQTGGTASADIGAGEAWKLTKGSKDVVVAVIDTGVDYTHEDLAPNIWINSGESGQDDEGKDKATNGKDDDLNGYVDDVRGWDFVNKDNDPIDDHYHGTHVAGTIGAVGNNGKGIVGVNWNVSILPIKFLSASGSGSTMDAIKSIEYAIKMRVNIMSNSWGGGDYSKAMEDAINAAKDAGILFVAAAGNSSSDNDDSPHYPSNYSLENVIAVASTDHNDNLSSFSCFGDLTVHLAAPGSSILSTVLNNQYKKASGTSMATPHVAGAAALIKSMYPESTYNELKNRLMGGAKRLESLSDKLITAARLNTPNSLEDDSVSPSVPSNLAALEGGVDWVTLSWNLSGDDENTGKASFYEVRYLKEGINDSNFKDAKLAGYFTQKNAEEAPSFTIKELDFGTQYFFAVRAFDNVGNGSPISAISANTLNITILAADDFNLDSGIWNYEAPWTRTDKDSIGNFYATDSPDGSYANKVNISMTSNEFNFSQKSLYVSFNQKYNLENGYDFGFLEIQIPESPDWILVKKYTGKNELFRKESINLSPFLGLSGAFKIRFRLQSDDIIPKDGWYIDNVVFYTENAG